MLEIGGVNVNEIDKESKYNFNVDLRYKIGIVMSKNFYMSGTLRDNILRKIEASDE